MKSAVLRWHFFFIFVLNYNIMAKIKMTRSVLAENAWHNEGDLLELPEKLSNHYLNKGIAVLYKEEKAQKETKEQKQSKKKTKNVSNKDK